VADLVTTPRGHVEWSSAGRAFPGEPVSGDLAVHVPLDGADVVAVIDGLGHGSEAAAAADCAREVIEQSPAEPIDALLASSHAALARTRGVAMTIASIGGDGQMRWVGVGNVDAHVLRSDGQRTRRAASAVVYGGTLGYRLPVVRVSTVELEPGDLVVMATDGIASDFTEHVDIADPLDRLVATIVARCARPNDDALVAAARYGG
jgi:phosphoserine phosphatase RsbX